MSQQDKPWFMCSNCIGEYELEDLGIYLDPETSKLGFFCPFCGWTEFYKSEDHDFEDPALERISENGPETYYPYPKNIIKPTRHVFMIKAHEKALKAQAQTQPPSISELEKVSEAFKEDTYFHE